MDRELIETRWDTVVVGTGMGGATLGHALAQGGQKILFCERGRATLGTQTDDALRGRFAEEFFTSPGAVDASILARSGRWVDEIEDRSGKKPRRFVPFIGSGAGGSSVLYGMALERFHPDDFATRAHVPGSWPISYDDLRPYYHKAESMFEVRGGLDPLRSDRLDPLGDPPPMTGAARELFSFLEGKGLHPYALPMACRRVPDCQGCQGFLCPRGCKRDSRNVCLEPAVKQHGARLLDHCRVVRLEATREAVTALVCERNGETFSLRADRIVLAAGALETPCLLLRSASAAWPNGLANASGMVGRHLMRHYIDLYALRLKTPDGLGSGFKELAFNDDYRSATGQGGTVQSFGSLPPGSVIVADMEKDLRDGPTPWLVSGFRLAKPILRRWLDGTLSRSFLLASIMEDPPVASNHVFPGDDGRIAIEYRVDSTELARIDGWRTRLGRLFHPYRFLLLKQATNNDRIAHACGTCRFGDDPLTSVLDADNRAHGLANLYVVDSSFFPTSAGINPALTIAANALRVADRILERG